MGKVRQSGEGPRSKERGVQCTPCRLVRKKLTPVSNFCSAVGNAICVVSSLEEFGIFPFFPWVWNFSTLCLNNCLCTESGFACGEYFQSEDCVLLQLFILLISCILSYMSWEFLLGGGESLSPAKPPFPFVSFHPFCHWAFVPPSGRIPVSVSRSGIWSSAAPCCYSACFYTLIMKCLVPRSSSFFFLL